MPGFGGGINRLIDSSIANGGGEVVVETDGSVAITPDPGAETVAINSVVTIGGGTSKYIDHLLVLNAWPGTGTGSGPANDAGIKLVPVPGSGGSPLLDFDNGDGRSRIGRNVPIDDSAALFVGIGGDTRSALQIGCRDARPVQLFTDDACRVIVTGDKGWVGIGVLVPDCALSVAGAFRTANIAVIGDTLFVNAGGNGGGMNVIGPSVLTGSLAVTGNVTGAADFIAPNQSAGYRCKTAGGAPTLGVYMDSGNVWKLFWTAASTPTLQVDYATGNMGFFGKSPVAQPTITGSRASGAALADLLTKGAALGLWVDGTTA